MIKVRTALIYLNGVFSHAMRKAAVLTGPDIGVDRRFQPAGGLTLHSHRPTPRELAAAERVLDSVPWARNQLLYARVDLISDGDADPILMELELTEPQLYFDAVPTATDRMTAIIEEQARQRHGERFETAPDVVGTFPARTSCRRAMTGDPIDTGAHRPAPGT